MAGNKWGTRTFLSLPTLTALSLLVSLAGLFYSASMEENFPWAALAQTACAFTVCSG